MLLASFPVYASRRNFAEVRWPNCVYADRLYGLLFIRRRAYRPPLAECTRADTHLPAELVIPASSLSSVIIHNSAGKNRRSIVSLNERLMTPHRLVTAVGPPPVCPWMDRFRTF